MSGEQANRCSMTKRRMSQGFCGFKSMMYGEPDDTGTYTLSRKSTVTENPRLWEVNQFRCHLLKQRKEPTLNRGGLLHKLDLG